ncbi:hypothetical protein [Streptomyces chryseus]
MEHLRAGCAVLAAVVTAVVLFGRWWATRNQAVTAPPWLRRGLTRVAGTVALTPDGADGQGPAGGVRESVPDRGRRAVHEAEAHLRQCWEQIRPLYEPPRG